jgi:hypothetical protein
MKTISDNDVLVGDNTKPGMPGLTPLGRRILAGYKARFGNEGRNKFMEAVKDGRLDGTKMFVPSGKHGGE